MRELRESRNRHETGAHIRKQTNEGVREESRPGNEADMRVTKEVQAILINTSHTDALRGVVRVCYFKSCISSV